MVILVGLPMQARAETAGMTVTAVKEKEETEPSSEASEEPEDTPPGDGEDSTPEDVPEDREDNVPEDTPKDEEDDGQDDNPEEEEDDEPDDMQENKEDDRPDETPEEKEENRSDDTPEDGEDVPDADGDGNEELEGKSDPDFSNMAEDKQQRQKYKRTIKMTVIMIGLIGAGIMGAVSGLWYYLWGLLLWYLFRKRKAAWHGILTDEENRFIQIVSAGKEYRLAQEIIDYSSDPAEAYGMLEETGDVTYLPKFCRVLVSFQMDGETQIERLRCDERQVYEFMENLGDVGDKRVLIESGAAGIEIQLVYP